jgi:hypothetical protein
MFFFFIIILFIKKIIKRFYICDLTEHKENRRKESKALINQILIILSVAFYFGI